MVFGTLSSRIFYAFHCMLIDRMRSIRVDRWMQVHMWLTSWYGSTVSFAEYRLFYRALLQKRPVILKSLRIVWLICWYGIAFGVSFLHSQISIDDPVLQVFFSSFRQNETKEIEIGDWDSMTLQMQQAIMRVRIHLWIHADRDAALFWCTFVCWRVYFWFQCVKLQE